MISSFIERYLNQVKSLSKNKLCLFNAEKLILTIKLKRINISCFTFYLSRPQDVIIFIVGGTTYEESRAVSLQNASNSGIRFILGGSAILNSKRYAVFIIVES